MTMLVRRKAGDPLSEEALEQLRRLAGLPDDQIDLSDIPERTYPLASEPQPALVEKTMTLKVEPEVAAWLETAAKDDPVRLNQLLKRAAHRSRQLQSAAALEKAS